MPELQKITSDFKPAGLPVLLLLLLIFACSKEQAPGEDRTPQPEGVPAAAQWTAGITADSAGLPPDSPAVLRGVRSGRHPGFDRVVFEFAGSRLPGYHLEYIDEPVRDCASGRPLNLPGQGWLQIRFRPARMHQNGGSTVENRDRKISLPVILRLVNTCDFENSVTWVAAVSEPQKYRVFSLRDPSRIVVDIRH